jgi:hypothetical protein
MRICVFRTDVFEVLSTAPPTSCHVSCMRLLLLLGAAAAAAALLAAEAQQCPSQRHLAMPVPLLQLLKQTGVSAAEAIVGASNLTSYRCI